MNSILLISKMFNNLQNKSNVCSFCGSSDLYINDMDQCICNKCSSVQSNVINNKMFNSYNEHLSHTSVSSTLGESSKKLIIVNSRTGSIDPSSMWNNSKDHYKQSVIKDVDKTLSIFNDVIPGNILHKALELFNKIHDHGAFRKGIKLGIIGLCVKYVGRYFGLYVPDKFIVSRLEINNDKYNAAEKNLNELNRQKINNKSLSLLSTYIKHRKFTYIEYFDSIVILIKLTDIKTINLIKQNVEQYCEEYKNKSNFNMLYLVTTIFCFIGGIDINYITQIIDISAATIYKHKKYIQ